MSALLDLYIKVETLETLLETVKKKAEKGLSVTISIEDESNDWGQNVSSYVSQSKEQREQKAKRFWVGNGKVFWTNGTIEKAVKNEKGEEKPYDNHKDDGLPF
jgi:hypothetical protein